MTTISTLEYLRRNWGAAYEITEAPGAWRAARRDDGRQLTAACGDELRTLIVTDYSARPVERDGGAE